MEYYIGYFEEGYPRAMVFEAPSKGNALAMARIAFEDSNDDIEFMWTKEEYDDVIRRIHDAKEEIESDFLHGLKEDTEECVISYFVDSILEELDDWGKEQKVLYCDPSFNILDRLKIVSSGYADIDSDYNDYGHYGSILNIWAGRRYRGQTINALKDFKSTKAFVMDFGCGYLDVSTLQRKNVLFAFLKRREKGFLFKRTSWLIELSATAEKVLTKLQERIAAEHPGKNLYWGIEKGEMVIPVTEREFPDAPGFDTPIIDCIIIK